ncbi:uncharacterized protein TrAtP1_004014 [Trichoderma atroviride]|uniref:uncharacterized protein n=1 Tax=Hypocrea atroviridis TaxID=63577 RepID=UPI00331BB496|nr:hypothetical protein TrAtP1_004014 [Trichoderma atroviride]
MIAAGYKYSVCLLAIGCDRSRRDPLLGSRWHPGPDYPRAFFYKISSSNVNVAQTL